MPVTGRVTNLVSLSEDKGIKRPNFFIVGAPKCGTTSMYFYLKQHPEVFMSIPKEPLHFCKDLTNHKLRTRDLMEYLSFFEGSSDYKRVGEASTWYLYSRVAAREINSFSPGAKIIIMLRNIPEAMYSLHSQYLFLGNETEHDFARALELVPERREGRHVPEAAYFPDGLLYPDVYRYTDQIRRYFQEFGRENVLVVTLDEMKEDVEAVYCRILDFLELDYANRIDFKKYNSNGRFKSKFVQELIQKVSGETKQNIRDLVPVRPCMEAWRSIEPAVVETFSRPSLSGQLRQQLNQQMKPEVERLSNLLDRDFSHWLNGAD